ncbi:FdhF/YdeP family oxidoreductase [Actinomadura oligospora]|uniref:FdhF/YdeP family oxidoreductase n=1 Tax=Actinomadura oligospora TaxID=111804 RepID=UPI0004AEE0A1|nr:FdhF/YdeP family oxidoreductase [Actinomadura oligospora]
MADDQDANKGQDATSSWAGTSRNPAATGGWATAGSRDAIRSQGAPGEPARGLGPGTGGPPSRVPYNHPTAGWGAAKRVGEAVAETREVAELPRALLKMNHEDGGFDCPGCAWPDSRDGLKLDICENGIKHVAWEMTHKRADRAFFAAHTVSELATWSDFALEDAGRLTEPMVYDEASDRYVPISWEQAFQLVGRTLRGLDDPDRAAFYTSGRLSNEGSFLYQLWVREFGTNNLPDCSNLCHEASGKALHASLGTPKGTVDLNDWDMADAILLLGNNAASNAPRMLTALAKAHRRGAAIVHVNPLVEGAARRTIVPHEFVSMGLNKSTPTGTMDVQVRIGGDMALLRGVAKAVLEKAETDPHAVDRDFLDRHTTGFEVYAKIVRESAWADLERVSGVREARIRELAAVYLRSKRTIVAWCLGITQHDHAVDTIREIVNVLMLRGNIGTEGAGVCPVRGHSNVQGNRTCGIDHRPPPFLTDRMDELYAFTPPRRPGLDVVRTVQAMHEGKVKVFVSLAGNFALACPDTAYTFEALRRCDLTVHVSTKLNRSDLVHGRKALILPTLTRSEKDRQAGGVQCVTVEDSMSMVHRSTGMKRPASGRLRSEIAILAGMARATLPDSTTPYEEYAEDYDRIRDAMSRCLEGFEEFNRRVRQPLGFRLRQAARERVFATPSGGAEFSLAALGDVTPGVGRLMLSTVRSHDQWNTSIYSDDDRYRGVRNLRTLVFMNRADMDERGLKELDLVDITSIAKDGSKRSVHGYRAIAYDIPRGCATGYMPELNVLCPIGDFSPQSDQPLMKQITVEIVRSRAAERAASGERLSAPA